MDKSPKCILGKEGKEENDVYNTHCCLVSKSEKCERKKYLYTCICIYV